MKRLLLSALFLLVPLLAAAQQALVISNVPTPAASCTIQRSSDNSLWQCNAAVGISQPLTDSLGLVANAAIPTKILKFDVSAITAATTRTWTIADANITVPSTIASLAANTLTGLQTMNGGLAATTGTFSSTLGVTGAFTGTSGAFSTTLGVTGVATFTAVPVFSAGLGAITSSGQLVVVNSVNDDVAQFTNSSATGYGLYLKAGGSDSAHNLFRFDNSSGVAKMILDGAGVLTLSALASGNLTSASGVITSSSDERLKDILGPLTYGLAEVLSLRTIRYHWNALSEIPAGPEHGGFGAAQVETVMPLAVSYGPNGMRGLDTNVILAAAVNATQELDARLRAVESKLAMTVTPKAKASVAQVQQEIAVRKAADAAVVAKRKADADKAKADKLAADAKAKINKEEL